MNSPSRTTRPTFRVATVADVPALVPLIDSAYRGESSRAGWTTEADLLSGRRTNAENVTAELGRPENRMIVMEVDDEIVACCQVEHRGEYAYFGMFAVRPTLQGGGFGRAVLAEAERFARETWGVGEMRMTVISVREELLAWYVRRGYTRTGETIPFPYDDESVGAPHRDDLEMELLVKKLG
ncbi:MULTISPECIES: GNAT family N-acetyltransferase [unclassified Streptosporangium]|uniref:GNAT family N-acetyltransferase n=1 Tax=unclassified Streptosporangium TaxID=2632669 RepID=UPI002E29E1D4|nr:MULTISPECIES: GNAT family N-acetyltransferase [unclassified Streptosporangium]